MIVEYAEITDIAPLRDNGIIAGCALLLVAEKPNSPAFITGKTGTVFNVYTNPKYRRKGYAKKIMNQILADEVSGLAAAAAKARVPRPERKLGKILA